ncbi:MAG: GGDEF domain-containing protein [Desulfarculaceae bacterium]|jgi:diguanylate cyclase (GGDEF)-like protein
MAEFLRNSSPNAAKTYSGEGMAITNAIMNGALNSAASRVARPIVWTVNTISSWGVGFKIRLLLLFIYILPVLVILILLEIYPEELGTIAAIGLVAGIIGFVPLSKVVSYLVIGKELKEIEAFCARLKEGDYSTNFDLPVEKENEPKIVELKRTLNWMAHVISHRESWLHAALEGAYEDKSHYESLANLDPLTGLANRRFFEHRLAGMVHQAEITNRALSIMFIDCDQFKSVNDNYGHQSGDDLLRRVAKIIRQSVRDHIDFPFRYGGDEFGVVCPGLTPKQAVIPAERIRSEFSKHRLGDTTLSIGIAGYSRRGLKSQAERVARFIKTADRAAYLAKTRGGNRVVVI